MGNIRRLAGICAAAACVAGLAAIPVASAKPGARTSSARTSRTDTRGTCRLGNGAGRIKHVIYLQFDNVHLRRDNPNVPSDLEQMPHLLNFLRGNGTVLNKQYTVLISHTAAGIVSSLTGLYPDRMGLTVTNSYDYYQPDGTPTFTSAFKYWTSPVASTDPLPNVVGGDSGAPKTAPAPWVSYTRDGCDVGNISVANTVLENNSIAPGGDIANVYGNPSPEASEPAALRTTDFVGSAVHCAKIQTSVCNNPSASSHAKPDLLPDEPGGYTGYSALFGAKYVDPAITGGQAAVSDINGNAIKDGAGNPGFPGFDSMSAANTLGYIAQMQEAGIPVTFAYISDTHDNHAGGGAYGPGEQGYVTALKSYDDAFGKFFARLAADGINKNNTLFVVTADENDHFAGQQAQNCDGVNVSCQYNTVATKPFHGIYDVTNGATASSDPSTWTGPNTWPPAGVNGPLVGEMGYNLKWLMGSTVNGTGYDISFDSAPSFYINGQPQAIDSSGNVVVNPTLRAFERKAAGLKAFDPYIDSSGLTPVARYLVDAPTLKALHMINADPLRTMSFTMFSQPDYYFQTFSPCPTGQGCLNDSFAWIHGDYSNDIGQTWLGMVGPGVRDEGLNNTTWTDHTDIVPTMNALLGLRADYTPDGRVITQALSRRAQWDRDGASSQLLGALYKQLDAPYGAFNHWLVVASTNGIKSDDATYAETERAIQSLTAQRDAVVVQMRGVLYGSGNGRNERLIRRGLELLVRSAELAGSWRS